MARKHREIFVSGHYLLLDAKLWASRNRSYPRTNIRAYFRANYWLLCLSSFKYFATHVENIFRTAQLFFCLECFLDCSPYFCNNHKKTLSHLELNFHSGPKVWKLGNMTWVIFTDISCSKRQQLLSKSCRAKSGKIKSSHSMFKIYSFSFVSRNSLDYLTGEHLRTNIITPFICTLFCRRR